MLKKSALSHVCVCVCVTHIADFGLFWRKLAKVFPSALFFLCRQTFETLSWGVEHLFATLWPLWNSDVFGNQMASLALSYPRRILSAPSVDVEAKELSWKANTTSQEFQHIYCQTNTTISDKSSNTQPLSLFTYTTLCYPMTTHNKWWGWGWGLVEILKLHRHSEGYSDSCDIFHLICPFLTELLSEEALSPFSAPWNPIDLLNIGTCVLSICSNQNIEMKSNKRTLLFLKETESERNEW